MIFVASLTGCAGGEAIDAIAAAEKASQACANSETTPQFGQAARC